MITADTITDEQIADLAAESAHQSLVRRAGKARARDSRRHTTSDVQRWIASYQRSFRRMSGTRKARARCAEILNARAK